MVLVEVFWERGSFKSKFCVDFQVVKNLRSRKISGLVQALEVHEPYIRHQIAEAYFLAA